MNRARNSLAAFTALKNPLTAKNESPTMAPTPTPTTTKKEKSSQMSGYLHAAVMLFCFGILLGTTYTEQQPYVYSSSHQALMVAIKQADALSVGTVADIWTWIDAVISSTGGDGVDSINANCQYDTFNSQEVVIDGMSYTLGKPSYDSTACDEQNIEFVTGSMSEVYLTGNHQLLSFGIFSMRSVPQYPVQNSVKNAQSSLIKVRSSESAPLNPLRDEKVVEMCDAPWGRCLHRDGFYGQAGSTFNWIGRVVDGYSAFQDGSSAYMILPPEVPAPVIISPCFIYRDLDPTPSPTGMPSIQSPPDAGGGGDGGGGDGGGSPPNRHLSSSTPPHDEVLPGNPTWSGDVSNITLDSCDYTWISTGYTIRETCLSLENIKPSPLLAYLARQGNHDDVYDLLNSYFGCSGLDTVTSSQMKSLYVTSSKCLESNILGDRAYGVFFSTANQDIWIRQSLEGTLQLQAHKYIDDNTRIVRIYFITRSLGREQLFYTIITVEFVLGVDGSIGSSVSATYVPMIMFQYGYGEYEWRVKDVYRFEIMLLVIFALFTIREIYQLVTKRLVWLLPDRVRQCFHKRTSAVREGESGLEKKPITIPVPLRSARVGIVPVRPAGSMRESGEGGGANGSDKGISMINYEAVQMMTNEEEEEDEGGRVAQSHISSGSRQQPQPHKGDEEKQDSLPIAPTISHKPSSNLLLSSEPSERIDVEHLVEEMNDLVDDLGDALEDIIDDYTPDSAGIHDMLDWLTILVITLGIIYRIHYIQTAAALHTYLMNQEEERTYDEHMEQIVAKFADIESQDQTIHLIAIALIAVGMLQFFRYLSFNKRFGIVTTTMAASTGDLLPVLIIFVSIVIAYAILASEIYGIEMEEYSTVQSSLAALFIVLLGNFDYYSSMFILLLSLSPSLSLSLSLPLSL
jgi:hypothetical protein